MSKYFYKFDRKELSLNIAIKILACGQSYKNLFLLLANYVFLHLLAICPFYRCDIWEFCFFIFCFANFGIIHLLFLILFFFWKSDLQIHLLKSLKCLHLQKSVKLKLVVDLHLAVIVDLVCLRKVKFQELREKMLMKYILPKKLENSLNIFFQVVLVTDHQTQYVEVLDPTDGEPVRVNLSNGALLISSIDGLFRGSFGLKYSDGGVKYGVSYVYLISKVYLLLYLGLIQLIKFFWHLKADGETRFLNLYILRAGLLVLLLVSFF